MSNTNQSRRNLLVGLFAAISGGLFLRKVDAQPSERDDAGDWELADDGKVVGKCEVMDYCEVMEEHFVYNSRGFLIETIVVYRD